MSDEIRVEENKCFCQSKGFRKFLTIAGGSFVGVFLALSLFAALHKPPMPPVAPCPCAYHQMMVRPHHPHHFDKGFRGDFHRKHVKEFAGKKFPPRVEKQAPDRVDD